MSDRPEVLIRAGGQVLTGHFRDGIPHGTVRPHGTNDWLIIYTAAGSGQIRFLCRQRGYAGHEGHDSFTTGPGDVVLFSPGSRHDYRTAPDAAGWDLLWAHFHPRDHWLDLLDWPSLAPGPVRLHLDDDALIARVVAGLDEANDLAAGPLRRRQELAMNALERVLLWLDTVNPSQSEGRLDARVRAAMDALCRDLDAHMPLARLARDAGLSASRFAHLFRDQVGLSVLRYREQQRLQRACQLLSVTRQPVQEVAAAVGFDNPFHFSTRFRRFTGKSPRAWRKARG